MNTIESYTKEHNGHTYQIKIVLDDMPDTSWLGEYTDKPDDVTFCVWRQDGTLRGNMPEEPEEPDVKEPERIPNCRGIDCDSCPKLAECEAYTEAYNDAWDAYDDAMIKWDNDSPEILANGLHTMGRNEYKYFVPYAGGLDPDKPDTDIEEWAKYAQQDYDRMEGLNRGHWAFVGVVVETSAPACPTCAHSETLMDALWGIESDSGQEYIDQVVKDCISVLEAEIDKYDLAHDAQVPL